MKRIFYAFPGATTRIFTSVLFAIFLGISTTAQPYSGLEFAEPTGGAGGAAANNNDPGTDGIETGVKFRVTQAGTIDGIRFFKGTSNTGTHIGHLWTFSDGVLQRTITFTGETAGGWQQMNFGTPFGVEPGIIYIASVYMPTGTYAVDGNFSSAITNDGIQFVGNGESANGVYDYTPDPPNLPLTSPPSSSFGGANYWVDVLFTPFFALPVRLTNLNATVTNRDVAITWSTEFEANNRGFEIQRSNDGNDWYNVGFVDGIGESTITRNYIYNDKGLAPGLYYYRLNQVDFDGTPKTSPVVTATIGGRGIVSLYQNYPNPVRKTTSIRFDLPTTQKIRLSVIDLSGREVKVLADKNAEAGTHLITLDASILSRQTYIIRLQPESGGILTKKIIVD